MDHEKQLVKIEKKSYSKAEWMGFIGTQIYDDKFMKGVCKFMIKQSN